MKFLPLTSVKSLITKPIVNLDVCDVKILNNVLKAP